MDDLGEDLKYIKGFNQGYDLKSWKPELFEHFQKGFLEETSYTKGFLDGGKQFEKEKILEQLRGGSEIIKEKDNNRDR